MHSHDGYLTLDSEYDFFCLQMETQIHEHMAY